VRIVLLATEGMQNKANAQHVGRGPCSAHDGGRAWRERGECLAALACQRSQATHRARLQSLARSEIHREARRHCGSVHVAASTAQMLAWLGPSSSADTATWISTAQPPRSAVLAGGRLAICAGTSAGLCGKASRRCPSPAQPANGATQSIIPPNPAKGGGLAIRTADFESIRMTPKPIPPRLLGNRTELGVRQERSAASFLHRH
jgi:hypothetical protein